jgi:GT2 family glycosyltransferase
VNELDNLIQIGITTKDRWQELHQTLERLRDIGLGQLSILVVDDGSAEGCPFPVQAICQGASLFRMDDSAGLIPRRNELAGMMTGKYYLSLDDDSYPVSGSLSDALTFAESRRDLFCLSFPIYNPRQGRYQVRSLSTAPYRARSFTGCGCLLHRAHFVDAGGYREELVRFVEEADLAARMFERGLHCYHYPSLEFHHLEINRARNWWAMDFYGARNRVLWNDWYVPTRMQLIKQSRTAVSRLWQFVKTRRWGHLQGQWRGLRARASFKHYRQRMNPAMYREWRSMPPG